MTVAQTLGDPRVVAGGRRGVERVGGDRDGRVVLRSVGQEYELRDGSTFRALDDISLETVPGEFVSIVGPSGCGKSTLLALTAGLIKPSAGEVLVNGARVRGVNREIGFIFQRDALLPWRTVTQNVALALRYRRVSKAEARDRVADWLRRIGLARFGDRYPHQLSGGQRKRVSIAATLVYEPHVLLMDEPFAALDAQTRDIIENDILNLWNEAQNQTVMFVTHDLEEAIAMSDRIVLMTACPGRVLAEYIVDLPRPRDLVEVRFRDDFAELHQQIWSDLKDEVVKASARERDDIPNPTT